jgi:hypothetical protein
MSELVVLVPVLDRPKNVAPLVKSFAASGAPGRLLFIADADDRAERAAIASAGAEVLVSHANVRTWPRKVNMGYRSTSEPWMLLCGDDVRFHPGWFQATAGLRAQGFGVIGTNDLGNARVLRGEHSTHTLVSRAYADDFGTIDSPGEVVHEGYRHCFTDDELIRTAKARGVWSPCLTSIVEHAHPFWKKAPMDPVYALGQESFPRDAALFQRRAERIDSAVLG